MAGRKQRGRSPRTDNDFYPTPQPLADAICQRLSKLIDPDSFAFIVEPSSGSGNFVQAARRMWPTKPIYAIDIRSEEQNNCFSKGATSFSVGDWPTIASIWKPPLPGLVLGNPPFSQASAHIRAVLDYMVPGTMLNFLLKMNFIGGKDRAENLWPKQQLQHIIPVCGRPSFKKTELANNDTNEYGIYGWKVGWPWKPVIEFPHIFWRSMSDLDVR